MWQSTPVFKFFALHSSFAVVRQDCGVWVRDEPMSRLLTATVATLVAGWLVLGSPDAAEARSRCANCGLIAPTVHVHTVYNYKTKTIHLDRSVTKYKPRYHRVVNVTRVQPIIDIRKIIVTHHHIVYFRKDVRVNKIEHLPVMTFSTSSYRSTYDCKCR